MSAWYWKVIALKTAFVLTCFASYLKADETIQKLPYCNPHVNDAAAKNDLVIVSTLDGRVTAFTTQDGVKAWDLETQPLLSSNLHHVELTSGGKWVRLVPSLRGTLYSVSGDTIEPLPFDAEQLLSSSFKYSDDLVIAGAHESVWLGLDALTGGVVYECGTGGCNGEQTAGNGRDLLVLRRHSNTVRALDPRSGNEKWNFSVAEHQLALSSSRECLFAHEGSTTPAKVSMVVSLPEGVVAVKSPDTLLTLWQQKLAAPVAGMWRLQGGALINIDVLNEATRSTNDMQALPPSLYIGIHDRQLYVQESPNYVQKLETSVATKPVLWKLKQKMYLLTEDNKAVSTLTDSGPNALSMITMYGNTGQTGPQGFFLYAEEVCDQAVQVDAASIDGPDMSPNESETEHHHIHVHVYSLWFWWKEVLLIAISSALLMNLMIWPRFFAPKLRSATPLPMNQEVVVVERHYEQPPPRNNTEYTGRFENDFTPVRQLGKGGFGIVFEARNNIDHCSYAVKRITLPKRESKRERVLREVRALAKLEHNNIVRYFNAWLEEPPPGWQEQRDGALARELEGVSLNTSDDLSMSSWARKDNSVKLNMQKCDNSHIVDTLSVDRQSELSKRHRSLSCNDSLSIVFDDNASKPHLSYYDTKEFSQVSSLSKKLSDPEDSYIVFAHSNDQGLSEARNNSYNKSLEKVKEIDDLSKTDSYKKKKGHRRHWSLDLCVKPHERAVPPAKMYLYIQMQLCHRHNLQHWLQHNRDWDSRLDKAKPLFSQIVSAVEYVHLAGLIHRDLKPSNIMFAPDGTVKVGDFGLVTTVGDSQDGAVQDINASATHSLQVGTHLYMSPEQLSGRPYSYKVDIYSLGVILFELLHPFGTDSERIACLLDLRHKRYPRHFASKYPQETEVLDLMLSDDPSKRPTASGVRARAPLYQQTDHSWHFTLPPISVAA